MATVRNRQKVPKGELEGSEEAYERPLMRQAFSLLVRSPIKAHLILDGCVQILTPLQLQLPAYVHPGMQLVMTLLTGSPLSRSGVYGLRSSSQLQPYPAQALLAFGK